MSTQSDIKKLLKYGAQAFLDMGKPIICGELRRQQRSLSTLGRKKWQLCYVILARDGLCVFDNKNSSEAQFVLRVSSFECALSNGQVDIAGEDICFSVRFEEVDKSPLIFACDIEKTRQKWTKAINGYIMNVKKFSADSAYASGGSLSNYPSDSSRHVYNEIDEWKVTTNAVSNKQTELDESGQHKKDAINIQNTANAKSDFPYQNSTLRIDAVDQRHEPKTVVKGVATGNSETKQRVKVASGHTGQPYDTIVQLLKSIQPDSDQQDSGFINVGTHSSFTTVKTPYTWREGVDNDGTSANNQRMQYLKVPVPESNSWPENSNELINDGNSQNIYENTIDDFANYSNVDEWFSFKQTKHCTSPSAPDYGAAGQTTKPNVATTPTKPHQTDPQRTGIAAHSSSTEPLSVQQDSAYMLVGNLSSSNEAKTPHEPRFRDLKLQWSASMEMSSNTDDSNSGEESPIYENANFDKVFERDSYMCEQRKITMHLKSEPIGTFCVRPGDETEQELAIKTVDGIRVFRIHEKNGRLCLFEGKEFPSLDKLLSFYSYMELPSRTIKVTLIRGYNSNTA